ncbi:hypothetical protein BDZ97DRAFT_1812133 [Flammula alnicola]|nr:hypothetical protein BDZ97DRAFT_1812133 [Flammula alnicola]
MEVAHDPPVHHHVGYESIEARLYMSLASVVCLLWEHALTISHEYTYVWKSKLTITKWLYLLLRYVPLICQVTNHIVATILFSKLSLSTSACAVWFAYQSVYFQITICLFELVILVRVWALYNKDRQVGVFLGLVFVSEVSVMTYAAVHLNSLLEYDGTCLVENTPVHASIILWYIYEFICHNCYVGSRMFSITPIVVQAMIWVMTWYKQANPSKEWQAPSYHKIVSTVFRDGLVVFLLFCTLFTVPTTYSLRVHSLTHSVWSLLTTILSVAGCRVIINMQTLKLNRPPLSLTSDFSCSYSTEAEGAGEAGEVEMLERDISGTEPKFPI